MDFSWIRKPRSNFQELFQIGLPLTGILIFHRHGQRLSGPNQYGEFFSPGKARVNQVAKQHLKMLGECTVRMVRIVPMETSQILAKKTKIPVTRTLYSGIF